MFISMSNSTLHLRKRLVGAIGAMFIYYIYNKMCVYNAHDMMLYTTLKITTTLNTRQNKSETYNLCLN